MAKLGEVCKLNMGQSPDSSSYNDTGDGIPFFQGNADFGEVHPNIRVWCNAPTKIAHPGEILISVRAPIGAMNIADCECCIGRGLASISADEAVCTTKYLWYGISSKIEELNAKGTGSTFKAINKKTLEEAEIPIRDLMEQERIAAKLDSVTALITLRKRQVKKLDELVKAQFVEMFGSYPENENAYPIVNVSDIADAGVGVVIKPAQYYVTEERGIKAFRSLNIGEMYIKDSDWVYFSTEGNESNKKSQLHENDLLIVRSGAPGTSCVVTKEFEGCNAVDVIIAHPNLSKVNPWYLCAYINYPHGKKQIEEGIGGAAQQHFNVGKCNNLKVLLPPLEAQNQFAAFVERVNQQKQTVQQSLEKLELMKKALMQEYFG